MLPILFRFNRAKPRKTLTNSYRPLPSCPMKNGICAKSATSSGQMALLRSIRLMRLPWSRTRSSETTLTGGKRIWTPLVVYTQKPLSAGRFVRYCCQLATFRLTLLLGPKRPVNGPVPRTNISLDFGNVPIHCCHQNVKSAGGSPVNVPVQRLRLRTCQNDLRFEPPITLAVYSRGGRDRQPPLLRRMPSRAPSIHKAEERRVGKECRSRWSPYH